MTDNSKKYKLVLAIHNGTLMSRDIEHPKFFDTEEESIIEYKNAKKEYKNIGYMIWFAELTDPDGNKSYLEQNSYR